MYNDRLFDTIMEEMMKEFGPEVRTDEGSLAYNACARIAVKLEEIYGDMDEINDNLLPDTQDDAHLIRYGQERGVEYKYATAPVVRGVFNQEIEIGERFSCGEYVYEVIEKIADYQYKMICDVEGVEANTNIGQLDPVDYVDNYQGGNIEEVIVLGVDDEDIEEYRKKVINTFNSTAFGGNKADYREIIDKMEGVGGCKPIRREKDSPWIYVYVIDSENGKPASDLIDHIQSQIDPEQNHGEGDGMAPICHNVKIIAVEESIIDVEISILFDTGYSADTCGEQVRQKIDDYLQVLCSAWESQEFEETYVRVSQIESRILTIEGILDVTQTKLNGKSENIVIDFKGIPQLGGVKIV